MKLNTKKTEGECKCYPDVITGGCPCIPCGGYGVCDKTCIHCQPTEKPIIEELDQHYWAGYHNGRMDGKYQALAEYKQKLIKRTKELKRYDNYGDGDGDWGMEENKDGEFIYLDEVEAVIRE